MLYGIAWDNSSMLYVADVNSSYIQVFDEDGRYVQEFGQKGKGHGELYPPCYLDVACDLDNHRVSVFDTVGKYRMGPGQLWHTSGIPVSVDHFAGTGKAYSCLFAIAEG